MRRRDPASVSSRALPLRGRGAQDAGSPRRSPRRSARRAFRGSRRPGTEPFRLLLARLSAGAGILGRRRGAAPARGRGTERAGRTRSRLFSAGPRRRPPTWASRSSPREVHASAGRMEEARASAAPDRRARGARRAAAAAGRRPRRLLARLGESEKALALLPENADREGRLARADLLLRLRREEDAARLLTPSGPGDGPRRAVPPPARRAPRTEAGARGRGGGAQGRGGRPRRPGRRGGPARRRVHGGLPRARPRPSPRGARLLPDRAGRGAGPLEAGRRALRPLRRRRPGRCARGGRGVARARPSPSSPRSARRTATSPRSGSGPRSPSGGATRGRPRET